MRLFSCALCLVAVSLIGTTGCLKEQKKEDGGKKTPDEAKSTPKAIDSKPVDIANSETKIIETGDIKFDLSVLEAVWGFKVKSLKIDSDNKGDVKANVLLEIAKGFEPKEAAYVQKRLLDYTKPDVNYHLFDGDNVQLGVTHHSMLAGEMTGRKGEAFRISINLDNIQQLKKVEARVQGFPNKNKS